MTAQHFAQFDIKQAVRARIAELSRELAQVEAMGDLRISITALDLFHLEALGYVIDFSTGILQREEQVPAS